jgi:hypothetical protein
VTVLRSPEYRQATSRVLRWAAWYTRGLDPRVAGERLDELASDLHDHAVWAEEAGVSKSQLSRDITRRGLRGAVDDLLWRRRQLRQRGDSLEFATKGQNVGVLTLVVLLAVMVIALGAYALAETVDHLRVVGLPVITELTVWLAVSILLAIIGLILLAWARTRFEGAILLALVGAAVVQFSFDGLYLGSVIVSHLVYFSDWWPLPKYALMAALVLLFAAAALWWSPSKEVKK